MDSSDRVDSPRQRLRGNFADVLGQQLAELSALAAECADLDVADALVAELERIRDTADVLGVAEVGRAARAAIVSVRAGRTLGRYAGVFEESAHGITGHFSRRRDR